MITLTEALLSLAIMIPTAWLISRILKWFSNREDKKMREQLRIKAFPIELYFPPVEQYLDEIPTTRLLNNLHQDDIKYIRVDKYTELEKELEIAIEGLRVISELEFTLTAQEHAEDILNEIKGE